MSEQAKERRRGYSELKEELHYFFRRIWVVVIVIGLTSTAGLVGFGFLIKHVHDEAIQRCENQNTRHDNAVYMLIAGSNVDQQNQKDSVADEEIRRRRDVTLGLIDALAPKTDCDNPEPVHALPEVTPIPEAP